MNIKLSIDGAEFDLGIRSQLEIANAICYTATDPKLLSLLSQSESPQVRRNVAGSDATPAEVIAVLLDDPCSEVVCQALSHQHAAELVSKEQIERWFKGGSSEVLETVVARCAEYDNVKFSEVYEIVEASNDLYLLLQLAGSYDAPKSILRKLSKHADPDIATAAAENL